MKKYIIIFTIVIVAVIGYFIIRIISILRPVDHPVLYVCGSNGGIPEIQNGVDVTGDVSDKIAFTIGRRWSDKKFHLVIESKSPKTDIVVTETVVADRSYKYVGDGVDITDSTSSLKVNINGKVFQGCGKNYPGI